MSLLKMNRIVWLKLMEASIQMGVANYNTKMVVDTFFFKRKTTTMMVKDFYAIVEILL